MWVWVVLMFGGCGLGVKSPQVPVHQVSIQSQDYHIDKIYPSMTGPYGFDDVVLHDSESPELLWIVGYDTEVRTAADEAEASQEWLCHANLDFEPEDYFEDFPKYWRQDKPSTDEPKL